MRRATAVICALLLLPVACTGTGPQRPDAETVPLPDLVSDVHLLIDRMKSIHPKLFHSLSRSEFRHATDELETAAATLDLDAFTVAVARFVAHVSAEGRDGHTGVFIFDQSSELQLELLPLKLYLFSDGVFVVDALEPYNSLIGSEVVSIGDTPIDEAIERLTPLVSRDNDLTVLSRLPWFLVWVEALRATEVIGPAAIPAVGLRVGESDTIERVDPVPMERYAEWADIWHPMIPARLPTVDDVLYLRNADRDVWMTYLEEEDAIYLQYNATVAATAGTARRLMSLARSHPEAEVIIDLRHNPGGDVGTSEPLSAAFARSPLREAEVIVLTGRGTFSAATIFVARLHRSVDPVLVGEPPGGAPNFYGDPVAVRLLGSDILVEVAGIYWGTAPRRRDHLTLDPDIPVELSSKDFFAHRDPVMVEALRH